MDMAHALGLNWMVCGGGVPDFENTDTIKRFADKINAVYEVASRNGFTMFQHNHAFEFERMDDGRLKYEFYHDLVPEAIKMELDTYWCANFGAECRAGRRQDGHSCGGQCITGNGQNSGY